MAEILPLYETLDEIEEGLNFSVSFTASLNTTESVKAIKIISHNFPDTVKINDQTFSGKFINIFKLPTNSLKYRIGDQLKSVSSFEELPSKNLIDIYSFTPPGSMRKEFYCDVELTYTVTSESSTGDQSGASVDEFKTIKRYTQPVYGNWSNFANILRTYLED